MYTAISFFWDRREGGSWSVSLRALVMIPVFVLLSVLVIHCTRIQILQIQSPHLFLCFIHHSQYHVPSFLPYTSTVRVPLVTESHVNNISTPHQIHTTYSPPPPFLVLRDSSPNLKRQAYLPISPPSCAPHSQISAVEYESFVPSR